MNYRDLEIWQLARAQAIDIHKMSLQLPKFELYETGSQIRRSSKSVRANIVEGTGRRRYKKDFIRFLIYAKSSQDETIDHLESLFETGSLTDEALYETCRKRGIALGIKLNRFIDVIERRE
ncbi:MAG: four helix bundle protein [Bacteroidota bacterium]